jgi:Cytochrome P460
MISIRSRFWLWFGFVPLALGAAGCGDGGSPAAPPVVTPTAAPPSTLVAISDDAALFRLVTQGQPFSGYALFPDADEFATGRLNGSEAHNPLVRVSVNARAMGALPGGRLSTGSSFPDGSVVFKELRSSAAAPTNAYAVMYKDAASPLAGGGWLWAEFSPNGTPLYSISNRGSACTGCHGRERGPQNDLVRTFERQR